MRGNADLLVIGPAALRDAVARALPRCRSAAADDLLAGVWTAGHREFDGVLVAFGAGPRIAGAIQGLREVAPQARIVVTCSPADEPRIREALEAGADDYVLEPVTAQDLETALRITALPVVAGVAPAPSAEEVAQLGEVLKHLHEGPQAALERLAELLRAAFGAQGASLQIDDLAAVAGEPGRPVLQEPVRRQDAEVGCICLGPRESGAYGSGDVLRLGDYARLIETVVTQARERQHWQDLAWRDDLSGLRNRRYFEATLDELLPAAAARRLPVTVLLFDIDDFKTYNDHFGHDTGDALIREVATLLRRCSREHDVVARYGGDEFAVIMWDADRPRVPGSRHPTDPMVMADRFRRAIGDHNFQCLGPHAPGPVTISGGLACFPWDGKARPDIVRAADEALLAAKRSGKNRIVLAEGLSEHRKDDGHADEPHAASA